MVAFSVRGQLVGGYFWHFGQNGQKLYENCKKNIFGAKYGGMGGGQANFLGSGGILLQSLHHGKRIMVCLNQPLDMSW